MRVGSIYVDRTDNGDYIDVDVTVTMDDKHKPQYQWRPYKEVETGTVSMGCYHFADNPSGDWCETSDVPKEVEQAFRNQLRKVADELGVPHLRLLAVMTKHYDRVIGSEVRSNETAPL